MDPSYVSYPGSHAVDGDLKTMAHSTNGKNWMVVDLGDSYIVEYVIAYNRELYWGEFSEVKLIIS